MLENHQTRKEPNGEETIQENHTITHSYQVAEKLRLEANAAVGAKK